MNDIGGMRSRPFRGVPQNQVRTAQTAVHNASPAPQSVFSPGDTTGNTVKTQTPGTTPGKSKKTRLMFIVGVLLILILAVLAGFFFWQYKESQKTDDGAATGQRIIEQVGSLYIVPEGEEPTVAEIRDKDKLKGQSFFDSAKDGDYLLVYQKAQIALLYRESDDKLVNVGPISTGEEQAQPEQQGQVGGAQTGQ